MENGFIKIVVIVLLFCFLSTDIQANVNIHGVFVGMDKEEFLKIYPIKSARTYRSEGDDLWITFNKSQKTVTFHIQKDRVKSWSFDDRPEMIKEYLGEFCSLQPFPAIYDAIQDVFMRMPYKDFLTVTNRHRPVIFAEFYDSGTARFASSQEMIISENDPPCCQEGFTLLKLGLALGGAKTPGAIKGVVAHELAHRVLDHIRKGYVNCDAERQANQLIKKWGFTKEYLEASKEFGHRQGDPVSCQEIPHKK